MSRPRAASSRSSANVPRQLELFENTGLWLSPTQTESIGTAKTPTIAKVAQPVATSEGLFERLRARLGEALASLVLTDNRSRIVSARSDSAGRLALRVHRSFEKAEADVLDSLARFLTAPRRLRVQALAVLRRYFQEAVYQPTPSAPTRKARLRPIGRVFDLRNLRDEINSQYFASQLEVEITWGKAGTPKRRRRRGGYSIRLGSYQDRQKLVRIHPVLDSPEVPPFVVAAVVHHEMVHAAVPVIVKNGRRLVHGAEFRRLERLFEHHALAEAWIAANVERLARSRTS